MRTDDVGRSMRAPAKKKQKTKKNKKRKKQKQKKIKKHATAHHQRATRRIASRAPTIQYRRTHWQHHPRERGEHVMHVVVCCQYRTTEQHRRKKTKKRKNRNKKNKKKHVTTRRQCATRRITSRAPTAQHRHTHWQHHIRERGQDVMHVVVCCQHRTTEQHRRKKSKKKAKKKEKKRKKEKKKKTRGTAAHRRNTPRKNNTTAAPSMHQCTKHLFQCINDAPDAKGGGVAGDAVGVRGRQKIWPSGANFAPNWPFMQCVDKCRQSTPVESDKRDKK